MTYENVILEKKETIAVLTVNRPKALNALNTATLLDIKAAVMDVAADDNIYVLIITGSGDKSFVAGADISEMKDFNAMGGRAFGKLGNEVFRMIELMEKPVIAAINGFALGGGCELSMCCDFRLASENARFGQPESGLGITPGFGGTQRLPRLIGEGRAKELIYTANNIKADEAYRIGLVNHVYPQESLMDEAQKLASKIARNAPLAVRMCKSAIGKGLQTDVDSALTIESDLFGLCFATDDQKEGMGAFVEKRNSNFLGK